MPFQFRFARLKSVRELEENLAQQRLALARQLEKEQEERLLEAERREQAALSSIGIPKVFDPLDWELQVRNCHELSQQKLLQNQECVKAEQSVEENRAELMVRMQKAKMMQSLFEQHSEVYRQQDALAEQKVLDEVGGIQHLRTKRTGR